MIIVEAIAIATTLRSLGSPREMSFQIPYSFIPPLSQSFLLPRSLKRCSSRKLTCTIHPRKLTRMCTCLMILLSLQDVFAQHNAQALKAHICTEVNLITRVDKLHAKTFMMAKKMQLAGQLEWRRSFGIGRGIRASPQLRLVSKAVSKSSDRSKDRPTGSAGVRSFVTTAITAYCVLIYTSMTRLGMAPKMDLY